ncbi:MAG: hypothetical protein K0R92_928 [Lachnospiraceae bacterium]|jgi:hypothetical protein|nr:hypothetical protein [Lachnospiraceae bacterium]
MGEKILIVDDEKVNQEKAFRFKEGLFACYMN